MLRHAERWDERPSGFILYTVRGGRELGAGASKASPANWDLAREDGLDRRDYNLTWAYSLQMSALGYISRFLRLYQHCHQISVWSDWLKDALFRSAYMFANEERWSCIPYSDTRRSGPAAASSAELKAHTLRHRRNKMAAPTKVAFWTKNRLLSQSHRLVTARTFKIQHSFILMRLFL